MADLVRRFPERFAGFAAALPLGDVEASLMEIDHAVGSSARSASSCSPTFAAHRWTTPASTRLARMEELDRMVWLHPTRNAAWPDYATERESDFGIWWSLGWPYETAAALSRLVYSGQMDRHPRLRVIAHHGGGMVPHFSARLAMGPGIPPDEGKPRLPPLDYFHRFYADTALFGAPHAVRCVIEFFGPEHVLFGTDTPLGPPHAIDATIADLGAAGLPEAELAAVYAGNAQRLLGVV